MSLLSFLGLGGKEAGRTAEPQSLIDLTAELEGLPPEEARFASAFAYLLARVAAADLKTDEVERDEMAKHLEHFGGFSSERAELLARSAVSAADAYSPSDDHLVARAFRDMSDSAQKLRLIRSLYAVAAADETISTQEDNEIFEVANALGAARGDVVALRSEFKEYLGSMKTLPGER